MNIHLYSDKQPAAISLSKGTKRTQGVRFIIARFYGEIDRGSLGFVINTRNSNGVAETQLLKKTVTERQILLDWIVKGAITAEAGTAEYNILGTGTDADGKLSEWRSPNGYVNVLDSYDAYATDEEEEAVSDILTFVAYVNTELSSVITAGQTANEAAERANEAAARANEAAANIKEGKDGKDGVSATHSWNGTVLTITSASGSSSADLKGERGPSGAAGKPGVYIGKEEPDDPTISVWINPDGEPTAGREIPTASSTVKGGVMVGEGLQMNGDVLNAEVSKKDVDKLSEEIAALKGGSEDDYREETITPDIQGYLLMTGVFNNTTTKARRTDYISLEGCTHIKAQYRLATNGCAVAFFDSNKTLMANVSVAGVGLGSDTITEMEPPAGAAYVMLSHYLGSDLNYVGFITLSYGTPAVVYDGNLAGVTIDVLGDSISSVAYVTPNYWQMLAEKTGCVFNDYAVSGTRIATVEGDAKESFLTRAARMDTNADAVLVMGGTNDVGLHTLLGEWDSEDTSTFYGALNALIVLLRANFPGKPIIFCTPIKRKYDTDNGFPDTMADLKTASATEQITMQHCVLAIKAKCARHGIPVIDLAEHSGFSPLTPEYYRADDDNLHPSALGFMRIANMVQPELEKQFAYKPD